MEFFPHSGVTIMVQALWVMNMDLSGVLKAATHFGLGLAMLCAVRIRPLASDLAQEVVTRFGSVTVDSAKKFDSGRAHAHWCDRCRARQG